MLKKAMYLLGVSFLAMICVSCSSNPTVMSNQQTVNVYPPDSLLVHPCKATPPGESLLDLARGYNKNVSCIGLYKLQMDKILENKKKQEALYNVK